MKDVHLIYPYVIWRVVSNMLFIASGNKTNHMINPFGIGWSYNPVMHVYYMCTNVLYASVCCIFFNNTVCILYNTVYIVYAYIDICNIHTYIYIYMHMHMHMHILMTVCIYIYKYIYIQFFQSNCTYDVMGSELDPRASTNHHCQTAPGQRLVTAMEQVLEPLGTLWFRYRGTHVMYVC